MMTRENIYPERDQENEKQNIHCIHEKGMNEKERDTKRREPESDVKRDQERMREGHMKNHSIQRASREWMVEKKFTADLNQESLHCLLLNP